jgi:hypothetical protein
MCIKQTYFKKVYAISVHHSVGSLVQAKFKLQEFSMISSIIRRFFSDATVVATADRIRSGWSHGRADNFGGQASTWYKG